MPKRGKHGHRWGIDLRSLEQDGFTLLDLKFCARCLTGLSPRAPELRRAFPLLIPGVSSILRMYELHNLPFETG